TAIQRQQFLQLLKALDIEHHRAINLTSIYFESTDPETALPAIIGELREEIFKLQSEDEAQKMANFRFVFLLYVGSVLLMSTLVIILGILGGTYREEIVVLFKRVVGLRDTDG